MKKTVLKKEIEQLVEIARKNIPVLEDRKDLKSRMSDSEDFFETAVWSLKKALIEAYELGKAHAKEDK